MTEEPFLPYGRQSIDDDDIQSVVAVLRSSHLTTGPAVDRFEEALCSATGASWAVAVSSGTAALHAACFAAGVSEGDEVIVPALTFVATANCARFLGAEPVFADVDPDTGLIRLEAVEARIGPKTKAIIPVHLTGASADVAGIRALLGTREVTIIEDATHAIGGTRGPHRIGACEDGAQMAAFSFHPVKHVTTAEGGAVTGRDPALHARLRAFRSHGLIRESDLLQAPSPGPWYYEQQLLGHNLRLSDLQAGLGLSQLTKLARFVLRRRALAARYDALFADHARIRPVTRGPSRAESAYHLYSVLLELPDRHASRGELMRRLLARGIGTQVHYIPLAQHPYYRARGWSPDAFPGAEAYYARTLSLPLFPAMTEADVDRVASALTEELEVLWR